MPQPSIDQTSPNRTVDKLTHSSYGPAFILLQILILGHHIPMMLKVAVPETPTADHERAISAVLHAHNERMGGPANIQPVAVVLNDDTGATVGGLWGKTVYDWLFIEMLAVPTNQRSSGLGSALMNHAEKIAQSKGCIGIWLDTFEFQALGFYQKLGFELFGQIDDHPAGHRRYFLQKRLKP